MVAMKQCIERVGKFYSSIILKSIGLFITYGILSIFFSTGGWFAFLGLETVVEQFYSMVIPLLIAYIAGERVGGVAGGLTATITCVGFFRAEGNSHMLGVLFVAPVVGIVTKKGLEKIKTYTAAGFEMLFSNLFIGIGGGLLFLITYYWVNPILEQIQMILTWILDQLFRYNFIPFMGIFIESGKVMFLNNTINHGLLVPLGIEQVQQMGSSILFLLETNPGPGFGILLAHFLLKREEKSNLLINMGIQLFGGIHELYFPYILSNSKLFLAAIAGGIAGNFCFLLFPSGLIAPPSPGSILTILLLCPSQNILGTLIGMIVSAMISCLTAIIILKKEDYTRKALENLPVQNKSAEQKEPVSIQQKKDVESKLVLDQKKEMMNKDNWYDLTREEEEKGAIKSMVKEKSVRKEKKVYFVCQGGFGSSAMGAAILRKKLKNSGLTGIQVSNVAIDEIPEDANVIFCQKEIEPVIKKKNINIEVHYLENLSQASEYESWISELMKERNGES